MYAHDETGCEIDECAERYECPPLEPGCLETITSIDSCERCTARADDIPCRDLACPVCDTGLPRCLDRRPTHVTLEIELMAVPGYPLPQTGDGMYVALTELDVVGCLAPEPINFFGGSGNGRYDAASPTTRVEVDAVMTRDHVYRPIVFMTTCDPVRQLAVEWVAKRGPGVTTHAPFAHVQLFPAGPPTESTCLPSV